MMACHKSLYANDKGGLLHSMSTTTRDYFSHPLGLFTLLSIQTRGYKKHSGPLTNLPNLWNKSCWNCALYKDLLYVVLDDYTLVRQNAWQCVRHGAQDFGIRVGEAFESRQI